MVRFVLDKHNLFLPLEELVERFGVEFQERQTFTLLGQSVQLYSNNITVSRWAQMYLTPFCSISDEYTDMAFYAAFLPEDASITVNLENRPEPSTWYYKRQGLCWKVDQDRNLVCSLACSDYYLVDNAHKQVLYLAFGSQPHMYKEPARLVSLMLLMCLTARGYLTLHASAAALGKRGIMFLGEKGSGKTTLLLRLIEHFGYGYLANDQLLLHIDEDNQLQLYGLPATCRIGLGTMRSIPSLATHARLADNPLELLLPLNDLWHVQKKITFTPYELGMIMKCSIIPSALLHTAIFPQIAVFDHRPEIIALTSARAEQMLQPMILSPNPQFPDWLDFGAVEGEDIYSATEQTWKRLLNIPVYQVFCGENGISMLDELFV